MGADTLITDPEGTLLAAGVQDGPVQLWSLPEGKALAKLKGHEKPVASVAMSSDGTLLVSGSWDETVKLWSLPEGELLGTLAGHDSPVGALALAPDGTLLVSADGDGIIKLWTLPEGRLAACLIDLAANDAGVEGITYRIETEFGDTREYTFPCGASIPAGAVCTCNCVTGSICICVGDTGPRGGQHYWHPC